MPFNRNDIYTSSGSVKLYNSWTPYVSKYDTSSFYNWEQDNLPLYDLEERTYELWEQAGFATSAGVPGLALVVSADAPAATLAANRNIFTSVSACIAAIPKVVRFPVLVEVANFGDMGALELKNFRIEEKGSIEIINRGFSRVLSPSATVTNLAASPNYNSYHQIIRGITSQDVSSTIANTSCISISSNLVSGSSDQRLSSQSNSNLIFYANHGYRKAPLSVALDRFITGGIANLFATTAGTIFESLATDTTIYPYDISAISEYDGSFIKRDNVATSENVTGNIYLNKLTKLVVENCDGPIFIRNFFVNSSNTQDVGIDIKNSNVVLENCTSVRNKESGFRFNNSKVILSRSAYSYRNYDISSTARIAEKGTGFNIINSEVILSSNQYDVTSTSVGDVGASGGDFCIVASRNYAGFVLHNSKLTGGQQRILPTNTSSQSILVSELNTGIGIELNNSVVDTLGLVDVYGNYIGIDADSSRFTFQELTVDSSQKQGIKARNSSLIWDSSYNPGTPGQSFRYQLDLSSNGQHIKLNNNSYFGFERKNYVPDTYGNTLLTNDHGFTLASGIVGEKLPAVSVENGSNLELLHTYAWADNHYSYTPIPGRFLKVANNSNASLFGSKTGCTWIAGNQDYALQQFVAGIHGENNSVINLHGPTVISQFGVDVLVENNSVLNIQPPKTKDQVGYDLSGFSLDDKANHSHVELHSTRACLVANKNSTINLRDLGDWRANWVRGPVGISTGAGTRGIVQDYLVNYSLSGLLSCGSLQFYPNGQNYNLHTQNSFDSAIGGYSKPSTPKVFSTTDSAVYTHIVNDEIVASTPDYDTRKTKTTGGVCVRAVSNSVVNVKNVHFPVGPNSSELDGIYYDASGSDCQKLMIWNIADTSKLDASYLSVSGLHPADTIYHGPSAFWVSSDGGAGYRIASGAPISTPDTGNLSILDFYGAGSSVWIIPSGVSLNSSFNRFHLVTGSESANQKLRIGGAGLNYSMNTKFQLGPNNSFNNKGIFRIYWSPKSSAKILANDLSGYTNGAFPHGGNFSGVVGPAYQIFAQGYNCSAPLSALIPNGATDVSSLYPDLLKLVDTNGDGVADTLWTSGFYYCSEMLEDNPTQCTLDESASKAFANAQNASLGFSGRPRKVTIHNSNIGIRDFITHDRFSEGYEGDVSGCAGFKSASIFDLTRDN